jgi:hypothetical protein
MRRAHAGLEVHRPRLPLKQTMPAIRMPIYRMIAQHLPCAACLLLCAAGMSQTPPTHPPTNPPAESAESTQPETASRSERRGRRQGQGRRSQEPGSRGRDSQGGSQGRGKKRSNDLPEFTAVSAPSLAGLDGKQYFWFTMYPDYVVKFDPESDTITQKVKLKGGMFWRSTLTHDRKRLLVVTNQQRSIEVIDLAKGTLAEDHLFQEEGITLRIRSIRECPGGVHWLVQTDRVKKEIDRYSFEASEYLLYDSANKKVVRKMKKLPEGMSRSTRLSADGTHWVSSSGGDLKFLDARTFKEIGKIDLSTPRFFGAGSIRLSGTDLLDRRDPNRALMMFTTTDPVEKRRTNWGLVDIDLKNREVKKVTEWGPSKSSWGMRVAYKPRIAVAMGRGRGEQRQIATYDLTTGKKTAEAYYEFRPRRSLVAISPDAKKIYVGVAGSDFEIFDVTTLARLPSVELEGEIAGTIHVVDG